MLYLYEILILKIFLNKHAGTFGKLEEKFVSSNSEHRSYIFLLMCRKSSKYRDEVRMRNDFMGPGKFERQLMYS